MPTEVLDDEPAPVGLPGVRLLNLRTAVCWIEAACRIIARRAVQSTEKRGGVANVLALDQTSRHGEGRQQNFLPLVDWKRYRLIPEGHRACMRTYDTFVNPWRSVGLALMANGCLLKLNEQL